MSTSQSAKRQRDSGDAGSALAPNVHVTEHPLILHKVTQLRQASLSSREYQQLMKEISMLVLYEATRDLPVGPTNILTSEAGEKCRRTGSEVSDRLGVVPVLRGGLGMAEAAMELLPSSQVWHLGIYRDKASLLPVEYYNKLPKSVSVDQVYVLDPMPISGHTAVAAIDIIKAWGASSSRPFGVKLLCLAATSDALKLLGECHPDVPLHIGVVDDDSSAPLMPSLGDVGDRLYNTF